MDRARLLKNWMIVLNSFKIKKYIVLQWFVIFSHGTFIGDTSKNKGTSNGQNNVSERDYASAMNVISGVKTSVHDISSLDADSVPKMGVHISPDLEMKLERVCQWYFNIIC